MNDTLSLLRKAALQTGDLQAGGGYLNPEQANRFIEDAMNATVLSVEALVRKMNSPQSKIEAIGFGSRILVPASEATDPGAAAEKKPSTRMVQLSTVESIAIVPLSDDALEDNIARNELANQLMGLIAQAVGRDLEELHVNGDSALAGTDDFLASNEGILKMMASHVADAQTLPDATDVLAALDAGYKVLPKRHIAGRNKREWRYYVHPDAEFQLRQALSERSTGAGDRFLLDDAPILVRGIPVTALPALPTITDVDSVTAGDQAGSAAFLTHPKNVVIGIQRAIRIEPDRDARARVTDYVVTVRADAALQDEDATVKITGIEHA